MRVGFAPAFLFAIAVSIPAPGAAQAPRSVSGERPVIGLVLSGGGARGGAHLGVIKALEELRVPVDVVAGTSIGAAIGGLYASGMTVEELEEFVYGIDWDAAFLNDTPRRLESFRRKREDELFLLDQRPGLDDEGFALPVGVVQGQVIDTVMARVTLPVAHVRDFDELALPFRAVAGDLETGDAIVLGSGNLGRAIRASMTVPAALTPIEIDGRLLVDGGIAMNLPVEIARAMGAERIIAIDISEQLRSRDELRSVVSVTTQLTNLLTRRGTADQIDLLVEDDILLVPDFAEEYSSVSFERLPDTIETGYALAMARRAEFLPYQLSPEEYAAYKAGLPDSRITELPTIDFIRFGDTAPLASSVVEARVREIEIGQPLDVNAFETALNRVYGLGLYQNVRYAVVDDGASRGLDFDLIDKSWGPGYVQLGIRYTAVTDENARFGLAASYLRTGLNEKGGEWRATFLLGEEPGFEADWYQPLGPSALSFVNPGLDIGSSLRNVFEDRELVAEVRLREATFEFGAGREFLDWGEVRAGFRVGAGDTELRVGDPAALPFDSFHRGELFARFSIDTLDNLSFPREGSYATVEWRGSNESVLGADDDYDQLLANLQHARTWGRHTLLSSLRHEVTISGQTPLFGLFGLGGFRDLSGLHSHELTGQHVSRLGASYYRRIGDLALFPAFVGVSAEVGNTWSSRSEISLGDSIWGGSLWAGVDTPAGPVFLAWGSAEGGDDALYLFLGRLF
jgi:NTE family protein